MGRIAAALIAAAALALPATAGAADLTVYSSLPLVGDAKPQSRDVLRGERLALEQAGGRAGAQRVRLVSLNDGSRRTGSWDPVPVARNARRAVEDRRTIAYLGEFSSLATEISLPILNDSGILQVSPSNTFVGLTRAEGAEGAEPGKYYPSGSRTFGRVVPADHLQAAAIAKLLQQQGVKRAFVVDDLEIYGVGLAGMVQSRLAARGIALAGRRHLRRRNAGAIARAIRRSKADAMVYAGITQNGAPRLWRAVHRRNARIGLFGSEGVAERPFTRRLSRGAARRTLVTYPVSSHPGGRAFRSAFRARFHKSPEPYAIYGYEAMGVVLDAIARAGSADRAAVVRAFFATRDRDSVLGRYSIDANGDTTLSTYGVLRISRKRLVYDRTVDSGR